MEQWSTLSNATNYLRYNRNPANYFKLYVKALEPKNHKRMCERLEEDDRKVINLDFAYTPEKVKGEYLDMYEGVSLEILIYCKV